MKREIGMLIRKNKDTWGLWGLEKEEIKRLG